jgi:protease-4
VESARGDKLTKPIEELAGGRVFTGAQALELGLIDRIGGFDDAVKFAAQRGGLPEHDINIRIIPEPPSIFDMFSGKKDDEFADTSVGIALALAGLPEFQTTLSALAKFDPLRVQAVVRSLQRLELIHNEGVAVVMPNELLIR